MVLNAEGCRVVSGRWYDPYTNTYFTDPKKLDIDHLVPLKNAHNSGAYKWDKERKKRYANDLDSPYTLIAVSASSNRSKGYKSPDVWMPANDNFHCEYIKRWKQVKNTWELDIPQAENNYIESLGCVN